MFYQIQREALMIWNLFSYESCLYFGDIVGYVRDIVV